MDKDFEYTKHSECIDIEDYDDCEEYYNTIDRLEKLGFDEDLQA